MQKLLLLLLFISSFFFYACQRQPEVDYLKLYPDVSENQPNIRVRVKKGISKITLACNGAYKLYTYRKDFVLGHSAIPLDSTVVTLEKKGFNFRNHLFDYDGLRLVSENGKGISVDGIQYYGDIHLLRGKNGFDLINKLGLEDYLTGVIGAEMPIRWPDEALRAQSIASRTYALFEIKSREQAPFHVENSIMSQVYKGRQHENMRARRLVNSTLGMIMIYDWRIVPAYFHSNSGGYTADAGIAFKVNSPPLRGRPDPDTPLKEWQKTFTHDDIKKALMSPRLNYKNIGFIQSVEAESHTQSGRIKNIRVVHSKGKAVVLAKNFRLAIGPSKMRSTLCKITQNAGNIIMTGRGWGHGVGMSQWGVHTKAKNGVDYRQILRYYYPGVQFIRIYQAIKKNQTQA